MFCGTPLQEFHWQGPFTVPEDASQDFIYRNLNLEFFFPHAPYSPDLAPSAFHLFGFPESFADRHVLQHVGEELWYFNPYATELNPICN
jgi:hypothetical protein